MNRRNIILNLVLIATAILLCVGGGISCCLSYGHGLGDIIYVIPLMVFTGLYALLLLIYRKKVFKSLAAPAIFIFILICFILPLIFGRGSECPCDLF